MRKKWGLNNIPSPHLKKWDKLGLRPHVYEVYDTTAVPHELNLLSSLEAAESSLNLDGSVSLFAHQADATLCLELTVLGLYLHGCVLHLTPVT